MNKITVGTKVIVNRPGYEFVKGTVKTVYEDMLNPVVLVDIDGEDVTIKAFFQDIIPVPEEEKPEEPKEKTITITESEFMHVVTNLSVKKATNHKDFKFGLLFTLFGADIAGVLFGEKSDND